MAEGRIDGLLGLAFGAAAPYRAIAIVFDPKGFPEQQALYSNASASDLMLVLSAAVAMLEAGELRMPVEEGLRWAGPMLEGEAQEGES